MSYTNYAPLLLLLLLGHLISFSYSKATEGGGGGGDSSMARGMDHGAMDALKKEISGVGNLKNWELGDYCQWDGITCDDQMHVKSINLSSRYLTGVLPYDALKSLTFLDTLSLQHNQFYGLFPCLANLSFLKEINFSYNSFTEVSDGTFANLTSLRNLSISNNPDLSPWNFPRDLVNSTSLLTLFLDNANINGLIPDFLASLRSLQSLNLSHNNFTGTVPDALSSLPSLANIDISSNSLNGTMPVFRTGVRVLYTGNNFVIGKSSEEEKRKKVMVLKFAAALVMALSIIVATKCCMTRCHCLRKRKRCREDIELGKQVSFGSPVEFSYQELATATNNFDPSMKLGNGGSCTVFEGVLRNDDAVAVKVLNGSEVSAKVFESEVNSLAQTRHCNVVRMVGYCVEEKHRLIVYEFMEYGSLDKWIFNPQKYLPWNTKYNIITQIAKGLQYLQEYLSDRTRILHRDIKPENVLLDKDYNAKLSDFGLAKILSNGKTSTVSHGGGTLGYMAPEVMFQRKKTGKSDVYSFGVVVLEIVFEKKNWSRNQTEDSQCLIDCVKTTVEANRLRDLVNSRMTGDMSEMIIPEIEKTVKLGLWCLNNAGASRPCMAEVVKVLEGDAVVPEDKIDYTTTPAWLDASPHMPVAVDEEHFYSSHQPTVEQLSGPR